MISKWPRCQMCSKWYQNDQDVRCDFDIICYTSDILVILISFATHLTSWSFWYHLLYIWHLGHFDIICYTSDILVVLKTFATYTKWPRCQMCSKWYQNDQDVRCVANDIKMNQQENKIWEKAEVILQILSSLCKTPPYKILNTEKTQPQGSHQVVRKLDS
jgi:hypothetical protein